MAIDLRKLCDFVQPKAHSTVVRTRFQPGKRRRYLLYSRQITVYIGSCEFPGCTVFIEGNGIETIVCVKKYLPAKAVKKAAKAVKAVKAPKAVVLE